MLAHSWPVDLTEVWKPDISWAWRSLAAGSIQTGITVCSSHSWLPPVCVLRINQNVVISTLSFLQHLVHMWLSRRFKLWNNTFFSPINILHIFDNLLLLLLPNAVFHICFLDDEFGNLLLEGCRILWVLHLGVLQFFCFFHVISDFFLLLFRLWYLFFQSNGITLTNTVCVWLRELHAFEFFPSILSYPLLIF